MPRYIVRFNFLPQERLDLRGILIAECGGTVTARSWEHALIEVASWQHRALMPAIVNAIGRGDYDVREDEAGTPRRPMGVAAVTRRTDAPTGPF